MLDSYLVCVIDTLTDMQAFEQLLVQRVRLRILLQASWGVSAGEMKALRLPVRGDDHANRHSVILAGPHFTDIDGDKFLARRDLPLNEKVKLTVIDNPHGTVSQVFSFIPLTSPVVMLMRIPFGVPLWQQILSVVILFATFIGTVWFAAKIYRVGILMYGKKASYKELIKWLKY